MSCLQIDYGDDHLHHHHLYTMFKQYPRVQAIPAFINFYSQKTNKQNTEEKKSWIEKQKHNQFIHLH